MSRMIFGTVLGLAMAAACGCGAKPEPTQPAPAEPAPGKEPDATPKADALKSDAPKVESPKADGAKAEPAKVAWEMDPDKHAIPAAPARGQVVGIEVAPEAMVAGDELTFRVGKAESPDRAVSIKFAPGAQPGAARSLKVKPTDPPGPAVPQVWVEMKGSPPFMHTSGYALTLEMGARKNGKVTGKVFLSLPDRDQSTLAGTFDATYFRLSTEKPGPDDAPYLAGDVSVTGAAPSLAGDASVTGAAAGDKVRVAYAAFPATGSPSFVEIQLPAGPTPAAYEYTRVEPGRYLVSVAVGSGPLAWKWVELPADRGATADFALDLGKTGGLEVTAPADAPNRVLIAPADDTPHPPLDAKLFEVLSAQTVRGGIDLVAGKAVVKNLGPGKYEVRFGDERRVVEVAAGKTAEVNLTPPKK